LQLVDNIQFICGEDIDQQLHINVDELAVYGTCTKVVLHVYIRSTRTHYPYQQEPSYAVEQLGAIEALRELANVHNVRGVHV
jgi:predicted metal-dependent HD superfamily phosphohydrolase